MCHSFQCIELAVKPQMSAEFRASQPYTGHSKVQGSHGHEDAIHARGLVTQVQQEDAQ